MKADFSSRLSVLDSRQLLAFVLVGRTLSFTQAAKQLYVTQSAVSHAVKALELELDQRLLDRNGKQLRVTPAGEHLLHYAEKVLATMTEARLALAQRDRWQANELRVAGDEGFCARILPGLLRAFRRQMPQGQIRVKIGETHECVEWLQQDLIDVGIGIAPGRAAAVGVRPLFTDEVQWFVAPDHAWAQGGAVGAAELARETFICTRLESYSVRLLRSYYERFELRLHNTQEVASLEAVVEMVQSGAGVTALAAWSVQKELAAGTLVPVTVGKRKLKRNWAVLRPLDRQSELMSESFVRFAVEATQGLGEVWAGKMLSEDVV